MQGLSFYKSCLRVPEDSFLGVPPKPGLEEVKDFLDDEEDSVPSKVLETEPFEPLAPVLRRGHETGRQRRLSSLCNP